MINLILWFSFISQSYFWTKKLTVVLLLFPLKPFEEPGSFWKRQKQNNLYKSVRGQLLFHNTVYDHSLQVSLIKYRMSWRSQRSHVLFRSSVHSLRCRRSMPVWVTVVYAYICALRPTSSCTVSSVLTVATDPHKAIGTSLQSSSSAGPVLSERTPESSWGLTQREPAWASGAMAYGFVPEQNKLSLSSPEAARYWIRSLNLTKLRCS